MTHRILTVLAVIVAIAALAPVSVDAQSVPRHPLGRTRPAGRVGLPQPDPDGNGPDDLADTEVFTAEEAAEFSEESIRRRSRDNDHLRPGGAVQRLLVRRRHVGDDPADIADSSTRPTGACRR